MPDGRETDCLREALARPPVEELLVSELPAGLPAVALAASGAVSTTRGRRGHLYAQELTAVC